MATLIFDFDGTLVDSIHLAYQLISTQALKLGCRPLTTKDLAKLKDMHTRDMLKYVGIPTWRIPLFIMKLRSIFKQYVNQIHMFPKLPHIIVQLHREQHQLGILTSNSIQNVNVLLEQHKIKYCFDFIYTAKNLFGKASKLKQIVKKYHITAQDSYYIGDEVRDIEAAHACAIKAIAVTWGLHSETLLRQSKPTQMITHPEQLLTITNSHSS